MPDLMGSIGGGATAPGGGGGLMPQPSGGGGGFDFGSLLGPVLGGGTMLATKLLGRGEQKDIDRATKNIRGTAGTASAAGKEMVDRASRGELTAPQQAAVDRMKAEQNARMQQRFAQMGIPISTMQAQAGNLVDQQAQEFAQKLIQQSFDEGIKAMGLGQQASQTLLTNASQQKADLAKTIGEVSQQIGRVFGTKTPTDPTQPQQSAQATVPEEWKTAQTADPWTDFPIQEETV